MTDSQPDAAESIRLAPRVFRGVRFDVHAVELPGKDGQTVRREAVVHPGAVVILPLLGDDQIVLIRNERFAVGGTLWELPAGTLEPGEATAVCAGRELSEEAGYRADRLEHLLSFYTTPGFCNERIHVYVARELTHVGQHLDDTERIEVHVLPLARVLAMVRSGEIQDGKTIASLLYYHALGRTG